MATHESEVVINLGSGVERERRVAALARLAEENGGNLSALLQKIADGELLITDPEQAYFWTPEWQAAEAEADADIAAGRGKSFRTIEDFIADLHSDDE